jgi:transposase-like protein
MKKTPQFPKSLLQATRYFADPDVCVDFVASMRWPDGVQCPHCDGKRVSYLSSRRIWKCMAKDCHKQFSVKTGSVFEDSAIPLDKWLTAVWLVVNCKNGISSYEIMRGLKVTQKSAWFMLHRIRLALKVDHKHTMGSHWGNPIEIDETFISGKPKNMHRKRARALEAFGLTDRKAIVMGMLNRETRQARAKVIPNVKRETLQAEILKNVGYNAHIFTDQHIGYDGLNKNVKNFTHRTVNHLEEYVRGRVHTQGIENFWSLLKRGLRGTYVAVEPFHLDAYVDEQAFRYNNRSTKDNPLNDADRFALAVSQITGKRLTYAELTGKVGETAQEPF